MTLDLRGLLIGALVGLVCFGGLACGLVIMIKTQYNQNITRFWAQFRYAVATVVLVGQFFASLKILDVFEESKTASFSVALGMVVMIFGVALVAAPFVLGGPRKK
jgi:hypothetical protein